MQDPPEVDDVIIKLKTNLPVCRVCLNISMEYIEFESTLCLVDGMKITYSEGFDLIAPGLIEFLKAPNTFCSACGIDLLNAYLFRKRIENSNVILNKINSNFEETIEILDTVDGDSLEANSNDDQPQDNIQDNFFKVLDAYNMNRKDNVLEKYQRKPTKIDDSWPASPKNSLYTDSDLDSISKETAEEIKLGDQKTIWMCNENEELGMSHEMEKTHRKDPQIVEKVETECKYCEKSFKSIEKLKTHSYFHKFYDLNIAESGKLTYICIICKGKFRSEVDFVDHVNIHKGKKHKQVKKSKRYKLERKEKCPHCNKMVRESYMEIHIEKHFGAQRSKCNECGKQFNSRLALRTHTLIHKQSGEFPCNICSKICQTMYALKSHVQFKHVKKSSIGSKLKYQCEDCGLIFQYPSKLRVHQRKHNADATYKCPYCNRSYLRKDQFTIHLRYHTNDLPYKCDRCDKSYATKNNLTEHTKSAHDNVTYVCDKCNQKFKSVTGLRKHKFLHTGYPYVCPICGLGQPFRSGIKAHLLRVHKDTFTKDEFEEKFPLVIPKSGFRRPKNS